jgi:hypothetical protein
MMLVGRVSTSVLKKNVALFFMVENRDIMFLPTYQKPILCHIIHILYSSVVIKALCCKPEGRGFKSR